MTKFAIVFAAIAATFLIVVLAIPSSDDKPKPAASPTTSTLPNTSAQRLELNHALDADASTSQLSAAVDEIRGPIVYVNGDGLAKADAHAIARVIFRATSPDSVDTVGVIDMQSGDLVTPAIVRGHE